MKRNSLLFFFIIFSISVFSQTNVSISSSKTSIAETESLDIIATLDAAIAEDAIVNFALAGTAKHDLDFTSSFSSKGLAVSVAGGNGEGSEANQLRYPWRVSVDADKNVYILDRYNNRIQKWAPGADEGSTLTNTNDWYEDFFVDEAGSIYASDANNHCIRKWSPGDTEWTTVAGGNGSGSNADQLNEPRGIFVDADGNIYIADYRNHRIQKWAVDATEGTTVAGGNGQGSADDQFSYPWDVSLDTDGNIYVLDRNNSRIQKWVESATTGMTLVVLNDWFENFFVDAIGNIFAADAGNHRILKWSPGATGWTTVAGGNGEGSNADQLYYPQSVCTDAAGNIYIADQQNHRIQKVQQSPQIIIPAGETEGVITITGVNDNSYEDEETIIVTPGDVVNCTLSTPSPFTLKITDDDAEPTVAFSFSEEKITENSSTDVFLTATPNIVSGKDIEIEFLIEGDATETTEYTLSSASITILAGKQSGKLTISTNGLDDAAVEELKSIIFRVNSITNASAEAETATLYLESDDDPTVTLTAPITSIAEGGSLDITATLNAASSKDALINFDLSGTAEHNLDFTSAFLSKGVATTVAGSNGGGSGDNQLRNPYDVSVDVDGNVYILDRDNYRIQKWEAGAETGATVTTVSDWFEKFFVDSYGSIYGVDVNNHRILKWTIGTTGWTTVAGGNGQGSNANQLNYPQDIYVDADGNLYIADSENHRVQKWAAGATTGTTVAGGNGQGSEANQFSYLYRVQVSSLGTIYILDRYNSRIQKWLSGAITGSTLTSTSDWFEDFYVDSDESVYGTDANNHSIKKWTPGISGWTVVAGGNGQGSNADQLNYPRGIDLDEDGNIYVADLQNHRIQKVQHSPQILIPAGETVGLLTISGIDDNSMEFDENIVLSPENVVNCILASSDAIELTITDNDDTPPVAFSFSEEKIIENSATDVVLTATPLVVSGQDIDIVFTLEGTATETDEYSLSGKSISIPAGNTSGTITISTNGLDDSTVEILETIVFRVSSISNAIAAVDTAVLYLESDDNPTVTFATPVTTIGEHESLDIIATLNAPTSKDAVINFDLSGTAECNLDFSSEFLSKGTATTVAGGNGEGLDANQLYYPLRVSVADNGDVYVLDRQNWRIQKWEANANVGTTVTEIDDWLEGFFVDADGNVYGADSQNHRIVKWTVGTTGWTTVAGGNGQGSDANQLNSPYDVFVDAEGNIFVADKENHRIQKWTVGAVEGTTVAGGNDQGNAANQFSYPSCISVNSEGSIYVLDANNARVQKWEDGAATGATVINLPDWYSSFFVHSSGSIYFADQNNNRIQKWTAGTNAWTTVAGGNGSGSNASQLSHPQGVAVGDAGNIYIADYENHRIQKVQHSPQIVIAAGKTEGRLTINGIEDELNDEGTETVIVDVVSIENVVLSGTLPLTLNIESYVDQEVTLLASKNTIAEHEGLEITASLASPTIKDVAVDFDLTGTAIHNLDYSTDFLSKGEGSTVASGANNENFYPTGIFVDSDKNVYVADNNYCRIQKFSPGSVEGVTVAGNGWGSDANQFRQPYDVFVDADGNMYIADSENHRIQKWAQGASEATTVAGGNGRGSEANQLNYPRGVFVDLSGNVYVADAENHRVQKWVPDATEGTTVAGGNGQGHESNQVAYASDVSVDVDGNVYVSEFYSNRVQKWAPGATEGVVVAGGNGWGDAANQISYAQSIFVDSQLNVYVSDQYNHRIQKWAAGATEGVTVAGGNGEGSGSNQLSNPIGIGLDSDGNIYVGDQSNYRVQKFQVAPRIVIKAGETEANLSINGIEDDLNDEGDETIIVGIKSGENVDLNAVVDQTITLLDNRKSLTLQESPFIGLANGAVAWGDYDRDGDQDVAIMGTSPLLGAITAVYENQDGTFVNTNQDFIRIFDGDISWVDINKDGWIDLVVSGYNTQARTQLYLNNAGVFTAADDFGLPQLFASKMAWGDLDNDGDIDLAISGINDDENYVFYIYYRENGQDNFIREIETDPVSYDGGITYTYNNNWPGFILGDLKIVDVDLDGDNDIVFSGQNSSGDPVGGVKFNTYLSPPFSEDYNYYDGHNTYYYDGYAYDISTDTYHYESSYDIYLKNSTIEVARLQNTPWERLSIISSGIDYNGNFVLSTVNFPGSTDLFPKLKDGDISIADFDNDGLNDIVFTGEDDTGVPVTKLFLQNSSGDFRASDIYLQGLRNSTVNWVDYDMDGDLDLFLTGVDNEGAKSLLYEAETLNKTNTPPAIVTGLDIEDLGNGNIRFSWEAPDDDFSTNLGYVLRLGTSPGGTELSNTESDLTTGRRLISKPAPIYTDFSETQLNPGIYYWSVQATDPGLKGGLFSVESSFVLTYEWKILNQGGIIDRKVNAVKDPVITLADIDNDDDMDLIYGSASEYGVQLLKYDGKRLVNMDNNPIYDNRITDAEVGDINGDGIPDILVNDFTYDNNYKLRIYISKEDYYDQIEIDDGLYKAQGRIVDLNNDGQAEVVMIGLSSSLSSGKLKFYIYEYDGDASPPSFSKSDVSDQITSLSSASFDLGDIDNDQDIDLVMSGFSSLYGLQSFIYENTTVMGESYQFEEIDNNLVATIDGTNDLIDIDGDGDLDAVITGTSITGDVFEVYENRLNDGIDVWPQFIDTGLAPMRLGKVDLGDFNGDGYSDLLYSGVVEGQGKVTNLSEFDPSNNTFIDSAFDVSDIIDADVEFGDLEGDGDLDFAISGESRTNLGVYYFRAYVNVRNESAIVLEEVADKSSEFGNGFKDLMGGSFTKNDPPATPVANTVKVIDGVPITAEGVPVEFSWSASSDDNTPEGGITYAFKVGKTPGGEEIMSSNSNMNGTRKSAVKGNAEHNTSWRLRLPEGTYYWSVQAIDASYAGSKFTASTQFVVSATVGVDDIDLLGNMLCYPNPTRGFLSIKVPGNDAKANLIVRNLVGAIVYQDNIEIASDRKVELDISNLPAAMYMLSIETTSFNQMVKITKE